MLDLPLGSGETPEASLPGMEQQPGRSSLGRKRSRKKRVRRPRRAPDKKRTVLTVAAILVVVVVGYLVFWPKPPEASFSPSPFELPPTRVSSPSDEATLTVTNIGERPMAIAYVQLVGEAASEFKIVRGNCAGNTLEPESSCAADLVFSPSQMGQRGTVLEVHAQMPDSPARIAVSGIGIAPLAEVSPKALSFGSQDVSTSSDAMPVTVANSGTAPLEIGSFEIKGGGVRDFRRQNDKCSKQVLKPEDTCSVQFVFAPRAAGERSVALSLSSDALEEVATVRIAGIGIWTGAAFSVEPKEIDFDNHLVGSASQTKRVAVTNRQSSALRGLKVQLVDDASGFEIAQDTCSREAIPPGENCFVELEFAAPTEGDFGALLQLGNDDLGVLGLVAKGRGVAPKWILSSTEIDLGEIQVGGTSDVSALELSNEGTATASVTKVEMTGADSGQFTIKRDKCKGKSIAPGSSCRVDIGFDAQREGRHEASVLLHASGGASPQEARLTALAVAPRLSLDLEMAEFGNVHRTTQQEITVTASNPGTAPLQVEGFKVEGKSAGSFRLLGGTCLPQATVPARQRCTVRIGFDPLVEGRTTARLEIQHNGFSGPKSVPLAGTGLPPPKPEIYLSTRELNFGPQPVGDRSPIRTVTINSAGTGSLEFGSFEIDGSAAADFHIVPATCHAAPSLLPGSVCAVGVRILPTSAGPRQARLVIRHNAGSRVSTVDLIGEGLGGTP